MKGGWRWRQNQLSQKISQVVDELSSNLTVVERLQRFEYQDKNGRDWGLNVRQRAKELTSLVGDPDRIRRERQKVIYCQATIPCPLIDYQSHSACGRHDFSPRTASGYKS